ncbi:hypothetical protein BX600DRAFT_430537 [Xylariales sp. PMI_506]|nr:hypothetical protein BX600DRAFT_430537 [Xylariales sp. PMI_506]
MNFLPPELAALVAEDLDIRSAGSLRLASTRMRDLFTPAFLKHLRVKTTDLSPGGLQRLHSLASSPVLSAAVSALTLTCIHYHKDPWGNDKHVAVAHPSVQPSPALTSGSGGGWGASSREWITERRAEQARFAGEDMFSILTECLGKLPNVRHLKLEASVVLNADLRQPPEDVASLRWRELWTNAIQAYRIMLLSIARSGIQLDSVSIYESTMKCSIPTHEVLEPLLQLSETEGANFAGFASRLKRFSISLATTTLPVRPRPSFQRIPSQPPADDAVGGGRYGLFDISRGSNLHASDQQIDELSDMEGVARLLHMMPGLESLHLHLCTTVNGMLSPSYYQNLLATLFLGGWRFPRLAHLALRGFRTSQADLQDVLARHAARLRTLSLENITLSAGAWSPVFALLTHEARVLERLRLSVLWSAEPYSNRMNLAPADRALYARDQPGARPTDWEVAEVGGGGGGGGGSGSGDGDGELIWYTREIAGEEVRQPEGLRFRPMMIGAGSPGKARWYSEYRAEYGPL